MQDFFFVGIISAIALGVVLFKSILMVIHMINVKQTNEQIDKNLTNVRFLNIQNQIIQNNTNLVDSVVNWKVDDTQMSEEFKQQFLAKTKTKRTPQSDRISPRERVPLATTDFGEQSDDDESQNYVPIYTYNPSIGGTQV